MKVTKPKQKQIKKAGLILSAFIFTSLFGISKGPISASPGGIQFQWDPDPSFKLLKSFQTSNKKMEKAFYYFFLRARSRKTGILKLSINVPDYFKAKIIPKNLNLCIAKSGGFKERTRCIENIPAVFEVTENQNQIDVFPDVPIPVDKKTYAVVMKVRNPKKMGMFQFHGYAQSPGAMPMSSYMGTWSFDVK